MYIIIYYYCYWDTHARKLQKALSSIASLQNRISSQASLSRKQQTTASDSIHRWPSYQRPNRVGFYCEARYDHHPWRQCSLYSLSCQPDNGGGQEAVTHHPLDCLKGWRQSDHTYHHFHRFDELATKSGMGSPDWLCHCFTSTFRNACVCTAQDMHSRNDRSDRLLAKQPPQVVCVSGDLKCWGVWDTTCRCNAKDTTPPIAWRREAWKEEALHDVR